MEVWRDELYHHGIKGMKWGVRRYQNEDGSLTSAGETHYYGAGAKHKSESGSSEKISRDEKKKLKRKKKIEGMSDRTLSRMHQSYHRAVQTGEHSLLLKNSKRHAENKETYEALENERKYRMQLNAAKEKVSSFKKYQERAKWNSKQYGPPESWDKEIKYAEEQYQKLLRREPDEKKKKK